MKAKPRKRSSKQKAVAPERWSVADPEPFVIDLLRRVSFFPDRAVMTEEACTALLNEVKGILAAWSAREDVDELKVMLGLLGMGRTGRRRTQRAVDRECAIALAYAEHEARGAANPLEVVMTEFAVEKGTVDRANRNWSHWAVQAVSIAREMHGDRPVDYSSFKK